MTKTKVAPFYLGHGVYNKTAKYDLLLLKTAFDIIMLKNKLK